MTLRSKCLHLMIKFRYNQYPGMKTHHVRNICKDQTIFCNRTEKSKPTALKENETQDKDKDKGYYHEWGVKVSEESNNDTPRSKNSTILPAWGVRIRQESSTETPIEPILIEELEESSAKSVPIDPKVIKFQKNLSKYFESPPSDDQFEGNEIQSITPGTEIDEWIKLTDKAKPFLNEKFTKMYNKFNAVEMSSIPPEPPEPKFDIEMVKSTGEIQSTDENSTGEFQDELDMNPKEHVDSTNTKIHSNPIDKKLHTKSN